MTSDIRSSAGFGLLKRLFIWLCLGAVLPWAVSFPAGAAERVDPAEPLISIEAQNEPLGQVLDQITRDTAYTFIVDEQWRTYPVRTAFQDLSLNDGLKRILSNLNHVIVYESDDEIRITIYGQATPRTGGAAPRSYEPPAMPIQPPETTPDEQEPPIEEDHPTPAEASEEGEGAVNEAGGQDKGE
jgi:hypothetical protein